MSDKPFSDLSKKNIEKKRKLVSKKYSQNPLSEDRNSFKALSEKKYIIRSEISKDRDRILFSKAFRRLEHKAQVYSHEKGDHYRTRLTHTLEVMQIARSIAKNLGLNEELTEAIALGHDIGHTPFGHSGENILNNIMRGKDDLGGKIIYSLDFGGFKHNFYGVKILDMIEQKYEDINGLNLTWQVLEGVLKHTKIMKNDERWELDRFMQDSKNKELLKKFMNIHEKKRVKGKEINLSFSVTLEGQIVDVADEIAQRQHDLDDGLRDKDLKLDTEKIIEQIQEFIERTIQKNQKASITELNLLKDFRNNITNIDTGKKEEYQRNKLIRDVIDYFIKDVTSNSFKNLLNHEFKLKEESNCKYVEKKIIELSDTATIIDERIEECIKNKILNSYDVNRFDGKAIFIIRQLFKAYYTNPKQMPKERLNDLINIVKNNSSQIYNLKFIETYSEKNRKIGDINFNSSKPEEVRLLIDLLKLENHTQIFKLIEVPKKLRLDIPYRGYDKSLLECVNNIEISEIIKLDYTSLTRKYSEMKEFKDKSSILFYKCLLENHYAFLSTICDYIAGMTDNYANSEFKKLYLV